MTHKCIIRVWTNLTYIFGNIQEVEFCFNFTGMRPLEILVLWKFIEFVSK